MMLKLLLLTLSVPACVFTSMVKLRSPCDKIRITSVYSYCTSFCKIQIYESRQPLKIGYYVYDDCIRCVPAVERGVMLAKATLEKLGHTVRRACVNFLITLT